MPLSGVKSCICIDNTLIALRDKSASQEDRRASQDQAPRCNSDRVILVCQVVQKLAAELQAAVQALPAVFASAIH